MSIVDSNSLFIPFGRDEIEQTIPERFEAVVEQFSKCVAIRTLDTSVSYCELNACANRVANSVLRLRGESEEPIALLFEPGFEQIVSILGVLKAGKCYVPLEPSHPNIRSTTILNDSGAQLLLTSTTFTELASVVAPQQCQVVTFDWATDIKNETNPNVKISPGSLAYIIYTSGSTGSPKGVADCHRNILHNVMRYTNSLEISSQDHLSLFQSCSNSGSVSSLFGALLNGASIHPFDLREYGFHLIADWMHSHQITMLHSVPSIFRHILQGNSHTFPNIRVVRLEGDVAHQKDAELFLKRFPSKSVLVNGLGSTECGLVRQFVVRSGSVISTNFLPLGYEVEDMEIHIVNEDGLRVGDSNIGEIVVKSPYLANGYWRQPDLTNDAFRCDPKDHTVRIYRTGDLGRLRADGCLEYFGRKNCRLKIQGTTVEVAEVESALLMLPYVDEAVVVPHKIDDRTELVAFLIVSGVLPHNRDLRNILRATLPGYMIPSRFLVLDSMPLNENHKVSRNALMEPSIAIQNETDEAPLALATTSVQKQIAGIWKRVLSLDSIGIDEDFFALGGQSITATEIVGEIRHRFLLSGSLLELFNATTVSDQAEIVETILWVAQSAGRSTDLIGTVEEGVL